MKNVSHVLRAGAVLALVLAVPALSKVTTFTAHLSGQSEVPARETQATGQAKFDLSADGSILKFRVTTGAIQNVTTAAIYLGAPSENGEAVAMLYGPVAPGGGQKSGVLAVGALASTNLVGPLAGRPLADLIAEMEAGRAYVNILTDDGAGGSDEKSGDFSSGEIRGQIR
ncbi:MAG TPA: CHRD domain-containing protein [Candidatus Eisenbacteria bacterium]|nr:CHRD domain-containing protein [Candidatus Eisenbacteria bacterium]